MMRLDQDHTESEHWVKKRTHVLIPEPMLFLTTILSQPKICIHMPRALSPGWMGHPTHNMALTWKSWWE